MRASFELLLGEAVSDSFAAELDYYENKQSPFQEVELLGADQSRLAEKILLLPHEWQSLLYFRYCFGSSPHEAEQMLDIAQARGRLGYLRQSLSLALGLPDGTVATDTSMGLGCAVALQVYLQTLEAEATPDETVDYPLHKRPVISLWRKLRRGVAVAAAVVMLTFSTAMVANAELREQVISWLVETFPQFSVFMPNSIQNETAVSPHDLSIQYIPEGFILGDTLSDDSIIARYYTNATGEEIEIIFAINTTFNLDTEDADLYEIVIKESQAFWWKKDGSVNMVWQQDGVECRIKAAVPLEEVLKIAKKTFL